MMFRPRLAAVVEARRTVDEAHDALARQADAIARAKEVAAQRKAELAEAEARLNSASSAIGHQPGQACSTVTRTNKDGDRSQVQVCSKNPATVALTRQLEDGQKDRTAALAGVDAANAELKRLETSERSQAASAAGAALKDAVFHSQLHAFTAMVFGIDPLDVTNAQIHAFLRLFVFLPAVLAAMASTLLATTAVTFHRTPTSPDYRLTAEESHRVMTGALAAAEAHMNSTGVRRADVKPAASAS
jgi:hypothetical protein